MALNSSQQNTPSNIVAGNSATASQSTQKQSHTQRPKNPNSTQSTLLLSEIRDNMVIMADGSFRAVIACKSINFDLMSNNEREGVEFNYQNFINSLNFPIQILIRSQRVDISPYINRLIASRSTQDNMLLGVLMDDYINFIDDLSQEANIMDKSFFVVIPYNPQGTSEDSANVVKQSKGLFNKLFMQNNDRVTRIDSKVYEKSKTELVNRINSVMGGLFQLGIQSIQLDTKKLGELYYNFYNPDTAVRQPLDDFKNDTSVFIKKGDGQAPLINPREL